VHFQLNAQLHGLRPADGRQAFRDEQSRGALFAWPGSHETVADDDRALHVRRERARPQRSDASQRPRSSNDLAREGAQHAEVVQRHHDAPSGDVEDRVDVEVELRRFVF